METPLITSSHSIVFTGKSYNKHPQWCNQPLRLTKEQRLDPMLVFDEFFQCYHLNETRQIFWDWLTEVASSSRSISVDSHERSNHMYFYEKMEELIEAAFIIKKRAHKQKRKKERMKSKKRSISFAV